MESMIGRHARFGRLHARLLVKLGLRFDDGVQEKDFLEDFFLRRIFLVQIAVFIGSAIYYIFSLWDFIIDPVQGPTTHVIRGLIVSPMLVSASIMIARYRHKAEIILCLSILVASIGLDVIYYLLHRGFDYGAVGAVLVLMFMFSLLPIRTVFHLYTSIAALAAFNAAQLLADNSQPGMILVNNLSIGTAIFLGLFSVATREYFARREFISAIDLSSSRNRIDELLYSMLPSDIVTRIQAGESTIADAYDEISIIFADLVGFTELTKRVTPSEIVEILNILFTEFDRAADQHGVERIKTIGDAYMAICGLSHSTEDSDHAVRMAEFALSMQLASTRISNMLGHDIRIRIGLHVGPVVAGVIGTKRPAFDCWGEAVNLASRLEHSAVPGSILISESAYWRLKNFFIIEGADDVFLKGIGRSRVFTLKNMLAEQVC